MSRKLKTNIPMTRDWLKPAVPDPALLRERKEQYRTRVQSNYVQHHGVRVGTLLISCTAPTMYFASAGAQNLEILQAGIRYHQ